MRHGRSAGLPGSADDATHDIRHDCRPEFLNRIDQLVHVTPPARYIIAR
jgi:hypothetical protein